MADISKITALDGATYDVKDATARTNIVTLNELVENAYRAIAYYVDGDYFNQALKLNAYIYIRNHSTLQDGLYRAKKVVMFGTAITDSDVELVGYNRVSGIIGGGLNQLRDKFKIITAGSLKSIKESGIYYLTSAVSDLPNQYGGVYIVGAYSEDLLSGIFVATNNEGVWHIRYANSQWLTNRISVETGVTTLTAQCTFNESVTNTNTRIHAKNGVVYVFYQGASKTHTSDATNNANLLFTLPSAYAPPEAIYVPFTVNNAGYGVLAVSTDGTVRINTITSTSITGRVYAAFSYPVIGN